MDGFQYVHSLVNDLTLKVGRQGLHAAYPNDFELYQVALELLDSDLKTIDYFSFPILPSEISVQETQRVTIKQSNNNIIALRSQAYSPKSINLKGTFGRDLLLLTNANKEKVSAFGVQYSGTKKWEDVKEGENKIKQFSKNISPYIKTGFGCVKLLQSIIDKSKGVVNGKSLILVLYNLALNESYIVVPTESPLRLTQDENSSNMYWMYDLDLTAIASADNLFTNNLSFSKSLWNLTKTAAIESGVKGVSNSAKKFIGKSIRKIV